MIWRGPQWGHRRGWLVVAAALVFGVLGGSAGMAVTTPLPQRPVVTPPVQFARDVAPEPVPTSTVTVRPKPTPTPTVVVTSVVKVFVSPPAARYTAPPTTYTPWGPTTHPTAPVTPSTPRDSLTPSPTPSQSAPATSSQPTSSTPPSSPGTGPTRTTG